MLREKRVLRNENIAVEINEFLSTFIPLSTQEESIKFLSLSVNNSFGHCLSIFNRQRFNNQNHPFHHRNFLWEQRIFNHLIWLVFSRPLLNCESFNLAYLLPIFVDIQLSFSPHAVYFPSAKVVLNKQSNPFFIISNYLRVLSLILS